MIGTSTVLNLFLCSYVYIKRRHFTRIANVFILHSFFSLIYCFGSVFALMSETMAQMTVWTVVLYAGMPFSAAMGLLFVITYLGIPFSKKASWLLMVVPFITFWMVATNDFHHLHYRVYELDPVLGAPYVHQEIGIWYVFHGLYTFGCMMAAFLLILTRWRETASTYRPQLLSLLVGQLIPIVTAFLYLVGLTPYGIDPVPMVLWLTSLFYLWSAATSRMFSLIPIAKDAIFNSINDGVAVLDQDGRIVEFNGTFAAMFPSVSSEMFGKSFQEVWPLLSGGAEPIKNVQLSMQQEIQLSGDDGRIHTYQVRTSHIQDVSKRKGWLLIFTDFTELKQLQDKLEHYAYYDELTGIYNRRAFFKHCEAALQSSLENKIPFTLILADLDHFKKINDTHGHAIGDEVLRHAAAVCRSFLSGQGWLARYGGEEFVIGLEGCTESEGAELAERLRKQLEDHPLHTAEGSITVTFSLGIAGAEAGKTLHQLLVEADKALYCSKETGRNRVTTSGRNSFEFTG
nr:diguanylate cyclase [Metabacillus mangrovi]